MRVKCINIPFKLGWWVGIVKYQVSSIKYIDIKSPERSTQKITINGYLLVNAKNDLGNEEHEERMIIKTMS